MIKKLLQNQFIKFCVVGGLGVITDQGTFSLVKYIFHLSVQTDKLILTILPFLGYSFAVSQNYILNHFWTFNNQTQKENPSFRSFIKFIMVSLIAMIPRLITYYLILKLFSQHSFSRLPDLANLVGIAVATVFNFVGSKYFVFMGKKS